jgi:ferredoxin
MGKADALNYRNIVFHVMSGTGNSLRVARWLGDACIAAQEPAPRISHIERGTRPASLPAEGRSLIGVFTPTHAFITPWPVLRYIAGMPSGKNADAFCISTRGGIKWGRRFIPGASGTAPLLAGLLLALKGYRLRGVMSVDMPSNWTACYSGPPPENAEAMIARARPRALAFFERIRSGDEVGFTRNNLYDLVAGLLLLPISLLYLPLGRFFLAKLFFANDRCTGCGLCAKNCPRQAIRMTGRQNPRPYWRMRCVSCMRCMSYCARAAVEAGHSWAVLLGWISHTSLVLAGIAWLAARWPVLQGLDAPWPRLIVRLVYFYIALWAAYKIFHLLMGIRLINRFFTWSTFTRFYRRYHEPETAAQDLSQRTGS